jgi:Zn-dependent protease
MTRQVATPRTTLVAPKTLTIGRICGAEFRLHYSVWPVALGTFVVGLVAAWLCLSFSPRDTLIAACLAAGLLVVLNIAHELGHVWVGALCGLAPREVVLYGWGATTTYYREVHNPRDMALVSAAGPLANLMVAVLAIIPVLFFGLNGLALIGLAYAGINLMYVALNLAPIFPRDGGRVVHALLWAILKDETRSENLARQLGLLFMLVALPLGWCLGGFGAALVIAIVGGESLAHDLEGVLRSRRILREIASNSRTLL